MNSLGQNDRYEVQCYIFGHVMSLPLALVSHPTASIMDDTNEFPRSRQLKSGTNGHFDHVTLLASLFMSYYVTDIGVSIR